MRMSAGTMARNAARRQDQEQRCAETEPDEGQRDEPPDAGACPASSWR